ncbi:TPR repeat protein [Aspergillus oryzae 100-8]|nr:TPR repeat protein [Aspergillus oryzae 100-8]
MSGVNPAEVKEKVKAYLSQESAGKWLLVFDNADDMEMWSKDNTNSPVLTDFLPQCEQGHILFTTRSRKQIQRSNKLAADYLAFMACINPRKIPQSLLPHTNSIKKTDAIGLLKAFSFVSEEGGDRFLNLHRLVHLATRNWMRKSQQFSLQILKTADHLSEAFPNDNHIHRKVWREYMPHALSLIAEADFQKEQENYINFIKNIGMCLYSDGRWKEAERLQVQVLELRKQVLGPEHPDTLINIAGLASIYWNQGQWREAEELEIQVLELRKQVLGPEHPDTLISMHNMAYTWKSLGKIQDALALMENCVELRRNLLGSDHPHTISSSNALRDWKRAVNPLSKMETSAATSSALPIHNDPPKQMQSNSEPVTAKKLLKLLVLYRILDI